ncbi:MAG: YhdP family protein [Rudaea sp.]
MTPRQRRIHHLRLWLQALFATIVIVLALTVSLVRIALPWIVSHPQKISTLLSERLNRTVSIDRVEGRSESDGPVLILHGIHIASAEPGQPPNTIPQAALKLNFFSILHRNQTWTEFRLVGLNLHLVRGTDGGWQLHGLDAAGGTTGGTSGQAIVKPRDNPVLFDLGSLVLSDLRLSVDDEKAGLHLAFAAPEVRLINLGDRHRLVARIHSSQAPLTPVDVAIEYNTDDRSGEAYIGGNSLDLAAIAHDLPLAGLQIDRGVGNIQVWGWWTDDRLMRAQAQVDTTDIVLTSPNPIKLDEQRVIAPRVGFDRVALAARWARDGRGWQLDVADMKFVSQGIAAAPGAIHLQRSPDDAQGKATYTLNAGNINLSGPASIVMLSDAISAKLRRWLYMANPAGTLSSASARFADKSDYDVATQIDDLGWHAVDNIPGANSISVKLLGDEQSWTAHLPAHSEFAMNVPRVFRKPLEFSEFSGDVAAWHTDTAWHAETDAINFEGAGYGGQLRGSIEFPDDGSRPLLDAYAVATHATLPSSHLFWPINTMPPSTIAWLDRALASGNVQGRAVIRGDLSDWPFRNAVGRFEALAAIDDATLVYLPDWPPAEHLNCTADFVNTSLHVDGCTAQSMNNTITRVSADIPDFGDGIIDLDVSGTGSGKNLLGFLNATPIGREFAGQLLGVDVGGSGKIDFHLHLPIKNADQKVLTGTVALKDADLSAAQYALRLNKANGIVHLSQAGFGTDELPVSMNGKPATFQMAVGGFCADPQHAVEAKLHAALPMGDLLAYAPVLQTFADRVSGVAQWDIGFSADKDTVEHAGQRLTVKSDLQGVGIALPAPVIKAADDAMPLVLTVALPFLGGNIDLRLGDLMHLRGHLASPTQPFAARVDVGGDTNAPLPASGFAIDGRTPALDLSGWLDFASGSGGGANTLAGVDVHADSLRAWTRDFGPAQFTLHPDKDELDLGFDGANVEGNLRIPTSEMHRRGITAQFKRLYWPEAPETVTSALAGENPTAVPPLHIRIDDFHLGHSTFGAASVESYPTPNGAHFEQVSTHSGNVQMRAHGDWNGLPGDDRSTFSIDFTAQNLGHMLDAFGYSGVVDGGQTVAVINGSWPGSPSTFALAHLDGTLKVSVQKGRIPEANPGAGRIFGLFNLGAIPRRLTLDFGDLFKSGFSFDAIDGLFTLKDGNAFTKGVTIKGTAAEITITGRTGLRAHDYDQIMQVTPHVGGTLAIGGALVGGPVGAAAGVVLQGIFKKQLNAATRNRYSVTGSWENPKITLLKKEPVEPARDAKMPVNPAKSPTSNTGTAKPATG